MTSLVENLYALITFRHLEQFWGASKAFWSERWASVYLLFDENDFLIYVLGR